MVSPLSVQHNKWIPSLNGFYLSPFFLSRGSERSVAELIDFNQHCWRDDKVRHLFLHHEAEVILQVSLNPLWPKDKLIWHFARNGIYFINSTYKAGMSYMRSLSITNGPSNLDKESRFWNSIHKLPIDPKFGCFYRELF